MPTDTHDARLITRVLRRLELSGISEVADAALERGANAAFEDGVRLMTFARRLAITTEIRDEQATRVHAHVISWFANEAAPGGKEKLDACLLGFGESSDACFEQVADLWLRLAGAPILSALAARPLLDADHFEGSEPRGIPSGHGFVGPFVARGPGCRDVDLDALAESPAFRFDGFPRDGLTHLAKVTLLGREGGWERTIELDGHSALCAGENWQGVSAPSTDVVCSRFALFFVG